MAQFVVHDEATLYLVICMALRQVSVDSRGLHLFTHPDLYVSEVPSWAEIPDCGLGSKTHGCVNRASGLQIIDSRSIL